ncbi:amidohydrolase family protein [Segeticoccus rhizosphaerae]|jgi:predicted TIM-barrel fold metal-dependent hydrolase|uniref:amidohydrolase family protein n=1 Tax=Segeticoccus rhizosphaerae TaxID=1104777 RepID=UPI001264EC90|nr:amidohydrolase family protein [Segeticoccus rhizosphaerae]
MSLDLENLVAIDTHVHVEIDDHGHTALPQPFLDASAKYFKAGERTPTIDQIAEKYRERRIAAVIFTVDAEKALGHGRISNEEVAAGAARHPDVLIPFGSIDPAKGADGVAELERLVADHGVRGLKFHPSLQEFAPNDGTAYPLFEALAARGLPAIFHTGQTGIGAGMPGGGGIKLRFSDPMLLDDVAADFPELTIIMAHPSVPWQSEAISVATHKPNVAIDLSGWSPKYFPQELVRAINGPLRSKVLFGSDYPVIDPDRWLADFDKLEIKPEVKPKVLKENAIRVLRLP